MISDYDRLLRPNRLDQVINCNQAKIILNTVIKAARLQYQPVGHILLSGPAGTGKTSLAHVVANEMGASCFATTGTNLATQLADPNTLFREIVPTIQQGGVLFVDEIHRTANLMQDTLLPLLECYWLAVRYRAPHAGYGVRKGDWIPYSQQVHPFCFIGATTRSGLLQDPFRDRFKLELQLDYYDDESMFQIARRSGWLLELGISDAAHRIIAQRSKGVPRLVNNFLWYARQWSVANNGWYIDTTEAEAVMAELGIDELGLDKTDRKLLSYLTELDRPAGATTLCSYLSIDRATLEDVVEPYLIRARLLQKTPRGRIITPRAIEYMKGAI